MSAVKIGFPDEPPGQPSRTVAATILCFSVLTFLITLGAGTVVVLSSHNELVNGARRTGQPISLPFPVAIALAMIVGFGPALAALATTAWESGAPGVRQLLRQFRRWKVHPCWYALALGGPAVLGFISLVVKHLAGEPTPEHWVSLPSWRLLGLTVGPWGEELGWRGYAQPKLQTKIGVFWASLIVGTIWSVWHYWPVFTPAGGHMSEFFSSTFATWLAYELANSVIMAWLYNSTGGSLPIAWAAHAGLTVGQNVVNSHPIPFGSFVLTFWVAAAVVAYANARHCRGFSSR